MSDQLAPLAFFAFKRPLTTLQSLYSLSRCPEARRSQLHIFCDGARSPADDAGVQLTREIARSQPWCGEVVIHEAASNRGLARSVIDGVTSLCASHGQVIVVEDDLLLARGFLSYMNEGLARYAAEERVMAISGYALDLGARNEGAAFLPVCSSWGWATWERAWAKFDESPRDLDRLASRDFRRHFDLGDSYPYAALMEDQLAGRVDSWAIRWWWTMHQAGGLALFPRRSLVKNIGQGPDATHTTQQAALPSADWSFDNRVTSFPTQVATDEEAFDAWKRAVRGRHRDRLVSLLVNQVRWGIPLPSRVRRLRDSLKILGRR
jgi:hypothetical protein